MDSAYIISVQIDNTEEVSQVFCVNKSELNRVMGRLAETDNLVVQVQSLGVVDTAIDYLQMLDEDSGLNYGNTNSEDIL